MLAGAAYAALFVLPAPLAAAAGRPAFYEAPATLPAGGPGTLIRSAPISFRGWTKPPRGTTGWKLLYTSTGTTGDRTVVSGSILLPPGDRSDLRLVTIAVGTHGMGDSCAPSRLLADGAEPDLATMVSLLRRGYAVAVTDYQGLGTAGIHPYAVNTVLGRNVLDVVRAARQVPEAALPADGPVGITGYSEGGGAAGSAAEQAATYAPDLDVVGTVAGGMLAVPNRAIRTLDGTWFASLALAGFIGYDAVYPGLDLDRYLNNNGRALYSSALDECQEFVARFVFNRLSWFMRSVPINRPEWQAALRANALGAIPPKAPIYLYHGKFDEALGLEQTTQTRNAWCREGANVRIKINPLAEHFTAQLFEEPAAFDWLAARFAGKPAVSNC